MLFENNQPTPNSTLTLSSAGSSVVKGTGFPCKYLLFVGRQSRFGFISVTAAPQQCGTAADCQHHFFHFLSTSVLLAKTNLVRHHIISLFFCQYPYQTTKKIWAAIPIEKPRKRFLNNRFCNTYLFIFRKQKTYFSTFLTFCPQRQRQPENKFPEIFISVFLKNK